MHIHDPMALIAGASGATAIMMQLSNPFIADIGVPGWEVIGNIGPLGLCALMVWAGLKERTDFLKERAEHRAHHEKIYKILLKLLFILLQEKGVKPPSLDSLSS